jgi:hypothetical protein
MSEFRYEVEIRVPPARVWAVLLDVERWPEWTTSVSRIQRVEVGPITLGSRVRIWQPRLRPAVWQVTSLDGRRRTFAWTTHNFGVKVIGRHQVETHRNISRLCLSVQYSGPLSAIVTRLYGNLSRDYIAREAEGLKKFSESLPASHPVFHAAEAHPQPSAQSF